jgi:hypothetical protein
MSSDDRGPKVSGAIKQYIQKNGSVGDFGKALDAAEPRPTATASGAAKEQTRIERRNYAQRLSEALAVLAANLLRANGAFPGVLPAEDGGGQESRARTGKGVKKLDVNYSTPELGLGLGVSIKTINFRDPKSGRYTKNPTRLDNELRAEALDYHDRQPYSVLVALVFVPRDSCTDGDATNCYRARLLMSVCTDSPMVIASMATPRCAHDGHRVGGHPRGDSVMGIVRPASDSAPRDAHRAVEPVSRS